MKEGLSIEDKIAISDIRAESALSFLEDANYSHKGARYRTAINRSYYSVLHMAKALLILKGISPTTHEGVRTMLALHFVKEGMLPRESIEIFKELLDRRTDVDYGDFITVDRKKSSDSIRKVKRFLTVTENVRRRLVRELRTPVK